LCRIAEGNESVHRRALEPSGTLAVSAGSTGSDSNLTTALQDQKERRNKFSLDKTSRVVYLIIGNDYRYL
jgi:hypothetical protein